MEDRQGTLIGYFVGKIHAKDLFIDKPHETGTVDPAFRAPAPSVAGSDIPFDLLKDLLIRGRKIQMVTDEIGPPRALMLIAHRAVGRKAE